MAPEWTQGSIALITGAALSDGAPTGTGTYVLGLARFLLQSGLQVELISNGPVESQPLGSHVYQVTERHVTSTRIFHRELNSASLRAILSRTAILHLQRPDDLQPITRRALFVPAVCTLHGDSWKSIKRRHGYATSAYYRRIEQKVLPRFRALVAVDEVTAAAYRRRYPALLERITVIPNAVDDFWSGNDVNVDSTQDYDGQTFLYVGRLSVEKAVDRIIGLFQASPSLKGARLVIAGDGPEGGRLRQLAKGASVEFTGPVQRERLRMLYRKASAVVLASEYEGMPTVALEALACGCPVAGLRTCGLKPAMSSGSVFVADSFEDLPVAMAAAAERRVQAPRIRLSETYTWHVAGKRLLKIYRQVSPGWFD